MRISSALCSLTLKESEIEFAEWEDKYRARQIGAAVEAEGGGVVVEGGETRAERNAGDVILDETVNVYNSGRVAQVDASDEDEHEGKEWIHGLEDHRPISLLRLLLVPHLDLGFFC